MTMRNWLPALCAAVRAQFPLALIDALPTRKPGERLGLVAFGGGITYAAAVATVANPR